MAAESENSIVVPERTIPAPAHVSAQAQAFLGMARPAGGYPPLDDHAAWKAQIAASDAMILNVYFANRPKVDCEIKELREGEALAYEMTPPGVTADDRRVYLDIHGGALIMGAGEVCKGMAMGSVANLGARVVAVDYRMPPDHPYPASLDDCMAFYKALLRDYRPQDIIVGGASAGGNLAAALLLRVRDEGLPLPAGAVLLSPELDLTESGDTFRTNAGVDPMGTLLQANRLYAGGADLAHPYLSPLFGDFAKGFPPTILTSGTRDVFLSNTVRMHRALRDAGIEAELHILEAAPHGNFGGAPDEESVNRDVKGFCDKRWAGR